MLDFIKSFFCIYWDDHGFCILQFVNVVYYSDLLILKNPCIPGINPTFIMVYDPFNVLMDSDCWYFVEGFWVYIHQRYGPAISFFFFFSFGFFVWFCYKDDCDIIEWVCKCSSSGNFWSSFRRLGVNSFLNIW